MYRSQGTSKDSRTATACGLSDTQFSAWRRLLEQRVGVHISHRRRSFLTSKLRLRMRALNIDNFDDYFERLVTRTEGCEEWPRLIDVITVHETGFFRDRAANDYLEKVYLPSCLQQSGRNRFHAWSLGCASGEEAYTLAMLIEGKFADTSREVNYGVTATDISPEVLGRARRGRYGSDQLQRIPGRYRDAFCTVLDAEQFEVSRSLRRRVCFVEINLLELERFPLEDVDLIFCQNVLMYFARRQRMKVLSILSERLAPGGLLVLGTTDVPMWSHPDMERVRWQEMLGYLRNGVMTGQAKEDA